MRSKKLKRTDSNEESDRSVMAETEWLLQIVQNKVQILGWQWSLDDSV